MSAYCRSLALLAHCQGQPINICVSTIIKGMVPIVSLVAKQARAQANGVGISRKITGSTCILCIFTFGFDNVGSNIRDSKISKIGLCRALE